MSLPLWCPNCKLSVDIESQAASSGQAFCPNCHYTIPIFDQDTSVAGSEAATAPETIELPQIPGYKIIGQIGQGGMGLVLEGRQLSLNRRVAIKVLSPNLVANKKLVDRFLRESEAMATLSHSNIVMIFERGEANGLFYFVMEFVEGQNGRPHDLRGVLNQRRLTADEVKRFAIQIADALGYAHQNGIVHRDIKPGNVMIDRHGNAKVADFGIASMADSTVNLQLTAPQSIIGTVDYMSPEQRDTPGSIDGRADVYSLGVMIYEMLTGVLPRGAYSPPSLLEPAFDKRWDELIARSMQPLVQQRIATMRLLVDELQKIDTSSNARKTPDDQLPEETSGETPVPQRSDSAESVTTDSGTELYQKYLITAQESLEVAKDIGQTDDKRLHHAHQAAVAAARARKYSPQQPEAHDVLGQANLLIGSLASDFAQRFQQQNQLEQADRFWEQVLEIDPNNLLANRLIHENSQRVQSELKQAERHLETGYPGRAVAVMDGLIQAYPGRQDLKDQRATYQSIVDFAKNTLQQVVPTLAKSRNWFQVNRELERVAATGVRVKGIAEFKADVDRRLAAMEPLLAAAEACLAQGNAEEARANAYAVLDEIADHPRAIAILDATKSTSEKAASARQEIQTACEQWRWFRARRLLRNARIQFPNQSFARWEHAVQDGCRAANSYLRILIWLAMGAMIILVGDWIGRPLDAALAENFKENPVESDRILNTLFAKTVYYMIWIPVISVALFTVRSALLSPFAVGRLVLWTLVWFAASLIAEGIQLVMNEELGNTPKWLGLNAVLLGTSLGGCFALTVASTDVPKPAARRFALAMLAGISMDLLSKAALLPWMSNPTVAHIFTAAIWMQAWMLITRRSSGWWRNSLILFAGLIASLVFNAMLEENGETPVLSIVASTVIWFTIIAVIVARNRRLPSIGLMILLSLLSMLALTGWHQASFLTAWFAINAIVVDEVGSTIDARFHVWDRLADLLSVTPKTQHPRYQPT